MADPVDISGMPDPSTIGLSPAAQTDPSDGMPEPEDLYRKFYFGGGLPNANGKQGPIEPIPKDALDDFMAHPPHVPTARETASSLTGLPRAAAGYALSVPAGVASIAGQGTGALGAALDPNNAGSYLEQGRERGREWAAKVNKLSDLVPATKHGAQLSENLTGLPANVTKEVANSTLGQVLPDNAYQAVGDVAQDIGTDLPALGAPGMVRGVVKGVKAAAKTGKAFLDSEAASITPPAPPAADALTPPVGTPITGDTLRAQPNPIPPPEGTVAHTQAQAAKAAKTAAAPISNDVAPPAQPEGAAPTAAAAAPTLPATDTALQDMSLSPDQRAIVREGVAARRRATDNASTPSPGDAQRGSVRLFNSPADEGPQETPAPQEQGERAAHLDAIDKLSGGGLPTRRTSALTGDYNATGDDFQMKEVGNEQMRQQVASENSALHSATENVHNSIGSQFDNSVDQPTLEDRGRVTRNALQGIEKHFGDMTDEVYDKARAMHGTQPMPQFLNRASSFLGDEGNYMPEGFRRAAQSRLGQLKTIGDNGDGTANSGASPGSLGAAEKFREWLNNNRTMDNAHVVKQLKDHVDTDVSAQGGPGLFEMARNMRRHQAQMLEEPTLMKQLLTANDSQGINHQIPTNKVMDRIVDSPSEQVDHLVKVLHAGAHLSPELAESSAAALREIQAHVVSRTHAAATNADGSWNARKFYNSSNSYSTKMPSIFSDRPDVPNNLKTINDAGNTLRMDKHYPGAAAQTERTGSVGHILEAGGKVASSLAHDIPFVGRMVGRAIESGTEGLGGKISESTRDKEVAKRIVGRDGKQRGSVGVLPQRDAIEHEKNPSDSPWTAPEGGDVHRYSVPKKGGSLDAVEYPELGVTKVRTSDVADKGQGWGTRMLQRAADDAHQRGQVLHSDEQVSEGQAGAYKNLAKLGYDVTKKPADLRSGAYKSFGDHVFEVRPPKTEGSMLNVGLHQGTEGEPGFRKMSKQEAQGAVESTGAKVTKSSVLTPAAHDVAEPTLVASTNRALTEPEMQKVLAKTKQSAIPQRTDAGVESMHVAPGHEATAAAQGWDKFNPDYFRDHDGKVKVPSGQRGSFSFQNDNEFNRATSASRDRQLGVGIEPRNERNERIANQQMGGKKPLTADQEDIIRRLGGASQRGSVRVMNEKPLTGAPEGDKPNGAARAVAKAYAKSAGIDYKPLTEYRYADPKVAKSVGKARQAAEAALRPHLISAAERLEQVRQERRAAGKAAPKEEE